MITGTFIVVTLTYLFGKPFFTPEAEPLTLYGNVDIREVEMAFRQGGRLSKMYFDEGDSVPEGALLGELDPAPFEQHRDEARAILKEAGASLDRLQNGFRPQEIAIAEASVKQTDAVLAFAQSEYARQKAVVHTGASTRQSLDQSQSSLDQAKAQSLSARQDLSLKREGFRAEDIAAAMARVENAEATLREAETALEDCRLISPSAGIILARVKEPGSMVSPASPVYAVSLTQKQYVRAYISETELAEARPGRSVTVACDSCKKTYHGTIGFVSQKAEFTPKSVETTDLRTDLVYRVRIIVGDSDESLRQGMPVTIHLDPTS